MDEHNSPGSPPPCPHQPFDLCEVKVLIKYAAERGLDRDGERALLARLTLLVMEQEDGSIAAAIRRERQAEIVSLYATLARHTAPVNGRTLLETERFHITVLPLYLFTLSILAIVIGAEVWTLFLADAIEPDADNGPAVWLRHTLDVCTPFLWGALGSCVWLLKRLADFAELRRFDRAISHGWTSRILLGAILGGAVQYLYDPAIFSTEAFTLGANAIGFLVGVGVKLVYGAIERTIDVLVGKFNLDRTDELNRAYDDALPPTPATAPRRSGGDTGPTQTATRRV